MFRDGSLRCVGGKFACFAISPRLGFPDSRPHQPGPGITFSISTLAAVGSRHQPSLTFFSLFRVNFPRQEFFTFHFFTCNSRFAFKEPTRNDPTADTATIPTVLDANFFNFLWVIQFLLLWCIAALFTSYFMHSRVTSTPHKFIAQSETRLSIPIVHEWCKTDRRLKNNFLCIFLRAKSAVSRRWCRGEGQMRWRFLKC